MKIRIPPLGILIPEILEIIENPIPPLGVPIPEIWELNENPYPTPRDSYSRNMKNHRKLLPYPSGFLFHEYGKSMKITTPYLGIPIPEIWKLNENPYPAPRDSYSRNMENQ